MKCKHFLPPFILVSLFLVIVAGSALAAAEASPIRVSVPDDESVRTERIIHAALKKMNFRMHSVPAGRRTAMEEANKGYSQIFIAGEPVLESSYPNLLRVPVAIGEVEVSAYVRDNSRLNPLTWADIAALRAACLRHDHHSELHAENSGGKIINVADIGELWETLFLDKADVVLVSRARNSALSPPRGIKKVSVLEEVSSYAYVHKSRADLAALLAQTLQAMEKDGSFEKIRKEGTLVDEKVVLHISSYNSELDWEKGIIAGIKEGLGSNGDIFYYNFNLNSRQAADIASQRAAIAANIRATFIERAPDVIIASDNDALEFTNDNYHLLFKPAPVVFCGINDFNSDMIRTLANHVTGCTESISVSATVNEMLRLYPLTQKIYVINDYTNSGRKWQHNIYTQLSRLRVNVDVEFNKNMPRQELLEKINSLPQNTLILLGSYFRDSNNLYASEREIQRMLYKASNTPIFSLINSLTGEGPLGGMVAHSQNQGLAAGKMARQIIDGVPVTQIPINYASESLNSWIFDYKTADKFNISTASLPDGHLALNRASTIWESHPQECKAAVLAAASLALIIAALLALLFKSIRKNKEMLARQKIDDKARRNAEQSVTSIIDHFEHYMANVPVAFAIAVDGIIMESNSFCRNELGILPGAKARTFYKNPEIYDKIIRTLEIQDYVKGEVAVFPMSNGEFHSHHLNVGHTVYKGCKGYVLFAFDIEELERQKNSNKRAQEDLQRIIDALPTAMAIINANDCAVEYANTAFLNIFGCASLSQTRKLDFKQVHETFFASWQGHAVMFDYKSPYTTERGIHLKMFADQIVFKNKNCLVLMCQDISSEIKQAEMLTRAAEKEKEANMMKSAFLANMSHEIRTPMNAIIGLTQIALMKNQTVENVDLFKKISASSKNLLSIINDILDFSKIEAEKLDVSEDDFCLEETISSAFLVASERMEDRKVEILLDLAPEVPCYIRGDKTRLWQILKNLLDNAVKYTSAGRIILSISVEKISPERVTLRFHIQDTGIGMSQDQIERLFLPFVQFTRDNTKKAGTGLGMSITKQLVSLMNGTIRVESQPNVGSDFYVAIPFKLSQNNMTIREFAKETVSGRSGGIGKVLLVDDDPISLQIMSSVLKGANIDSVCASDGAEALRLIKENAEQGNPFETIILDYLIGEEDGIDLAKQIGSHVVNNTKLLLVTAYARRIISESVLKEAKIRDIIEKPFVVSSFLEKICNAVPKDLSLPNLQGAKFPKAKVLLCEDNSINQEVAMGILESFGIIPALAENGKEALNLLEQRPFDLVFMDMIMPIMDGHEATRIIRQSSKPYSNVPIVAMTANVMAHEVEQCASEGINDFVPKPIDINKLEKVLIRYLGRIY